MRCLRGIMDRDAHPDFGLLGLLLLYIYSVQWTRVVMVYVE